MVYARLLLTSLMLALMMFCGLPASTTPEPQGPPPGYRLVPEEKYRELIALAAEGLEYRRANDAATAKIGTLESQLQALIDSLGQLQTDLADARQKTEDANAGAERLKVLYQASQDAHKEAMSRETKRRWRWLLYGAAGGLITGYILTR